MYKKEKKFFSSINKSKSILEDLQREFGGELLSEGTKKSTKLVEKRKILKINPFCYIEDIEDGDLVLTTYIYGMIHQVTGKTEICKVLSANIANKKAYY